MKKILMVGLGFLIVGMLFGIGRAITVNPASSVTADSAATALTIPYRDSSGNFSANIVTGAVSYTNKTIAQLQALVPAAKGETYFCSDCAVAGLVDSTGTAAGQFNFVGGAQFK